jgi:hypothetical protein
MITEHNVMPKMSDKEASKLSGKLLGDKDFNLLINYDADVICQESGNVIAKFRKNIIPGNIAKAGFENLKTAAKHTNNRGVSSGDVETDILKRRPVKKDGTMSNTNKALQKVNSGIIGFFDRNARFPYCRQTAFNEHEFKKFKNAYPIIKFVDKKYSELMPEHYKLQRKIADETSKDFVIPDTAFTTVTVNKNWQTAVHTDKGDFEKGFGNLVVLRKGRYTGGYFVVPKWGVAFDIQNCDLLLVDVHQWHGNTPINKIDEKATRISLVMYYREKMISCGSADEELNIAKNRSKGQKIY